MATEYNASIPTDGLSLLLDSANPKSWSQNTFPSALDIYTWYVTRRGDNTGNASTYTRDTSAAPSPAGGVPMKMSITGNDPHISSYNGVQWNIAPAASGQTWIVSVWARASVNSTGQIFIFGADSSGISSDGLGGWWNIASKTINITTTWQRFDHFITFNNANVANIQLRLDGLDSGGAGIDVWWDGLQVEKAETSTAVSPFNPRYNQNGVNWLNLVGTNKCTLTECNYNLASRSIAFNGTSSVGVMGSAVTNSNIGSTLLFAINKSDEVARTIFANANGGASRILEVNATGGFRTETNSNENSFNCPTSPSVANIWQFFAVKFTPAKKSTWYFNGNNVGQTTDYGIVNADTNRPIDHLFDSFTWQRIGDNSFYSGKYAGRISMVAKYDRDLSDNEVYTFFSSIRSRYGI